ncbi:MAG: hypothetical protein WA755_16055 [Candidatus Acidiferrales bacterium]
MTRRGSLAYYLAAWICGSFFMSVEISLKDRLALVGAIIPVGARFLYFCFFALILGIAPSLIAALLLRRTMILVGRKRPILWTAAGALITAGLVITVGGWARNSLGLIHSHAYPAELVFALTGGLAFVAVEGWWLALPAGAATAYILYRIDRAFSPEQLANDQPAVPVSHSS